MSDERWTWAEDGKSLTIGGKKFDVAPAKQEEVFEFARIWERALYSLQTIVRRENAFVLGETTFAAAADDLEQLFDQKMIAKARLEQACKNADCFFIPAGIHAEFREAEEISTFIRGLVQRLS